MVRSRHLAWAILLTPWAGWGGQVSGQPLWRFTDVTDAAGLTSTHEYVAGGHATLAQRAAGGVASGDYDGDGRDDLVIYRNGVWFVCTQLNGVAAATFGYGTNGDLPLAGVFH